MKKGSSIKITKSKPLLGDGVLWTCGLRFLKPLTAMRHSSGGLRLDDGRRSRKIGGIKVRCGRSSLEPGPAKLPKTQHMIRGIGAYFRRRV
jgi:hypothetical protein